MSLRFVLGPSGAGKSRQLYNEIIKRAEAEPWRNFLIIVPDQFTMQTQKDFVMLSDRGGIMNIDVLSFGRLSHRIMEEVGSTNVPVLDDTGKSLVLQKVASGLKGELPALGSFLSKQGYIHEVKSAISEFMQYGIGVDDVDTLILRAEKKGALSLKLKDLKVLYKGFKDYIQDSFITTEETLDVLKHSLNKSSIIPDSVVVFDGFTGFTPIQNSVIQEIMCLSAETIVVLTIGEGEYPYEPDGEQKLFHLSKKTLHDLEKLASEAGVGRLKDTYVMPVSKYNAAQGNLVSFGDKNKERVFASCCEVLVNENHRFKDSLALQTLEKGLFRYKYDVCPKSNGEIVMYETTTPAEEVHCLGLYISELIREQKLAYRDIAVITGDLEAYAPYIQSEFEQMKIPGYIDRTRGITLNPMIEFIKSALGLFINDFSYESVFSYLRSGMTDIPREDIDLLENYCLQTGIKGRKRWNRMFTRKTPEMKEDEEKLQHINFIREKLIESIGDITGESKSTAKSYVNQLYDFLVTNNVQQRLVEFQNYFNKEGELSREREYAQIYRLVMELLNQVYELLGDEEITIKEFLEILSAGFDEIQVGTIPQNVDRVLVGDMERTRLRQVKVLFFLGLNDGNIPKSAVKGGIISDTDREFLRESGLELAPSPRQQMFIQRLYLYLNMTKPSDRLYLSYSKMNTQGKSIRPSYLVDTIRKMFPDVATEYPQSSRIKGIIVTPKEGMRYLSEGLREYAADVMDSTGEQDFFTLYKAYEILAENEGDSSKAGGGTTLKEMTDAAFKIYRESPLSKAVARALYGVTLENSVSRLETFAACAYRHFLQYGLTLKERAEFGFEAVDMGNVYHGVLEIFGGKLREKGYTWFDFPKEFGESAVSEALEEYAAEYGETVLYSTSRNEYAITRMCRILTRTVFSIQSQLKKGKFAPERYEVAFSFEKDLENVNVALSQGEKMHLKGRIDRIDTAEDEEHVYVKVIDYKSGDRQFDIAALYYGLQLQLVVYMNAAMEMEAKSHPEKQIVPAALLYYHVTDPTVESTEELTDEEINEQILAKLRMNGVVSSEPGIIEKLDMYMQDKSDVIPVEKKKDGTYSARSGIMTGEELRLVSNYVNHKLRDIGTDILSGNIELNPYEKGGERACTYCPYKKVCGFDESLPGMKIRGLEAIDKGTALGMMSEICGN